MGLVGRCWRFGGRTLYHVRRAAANLTFWVLPDSEIHDDQGFMHLVLGSLQRRISKLSKRVQGSTVFLTTLVCTRSDNARRPSPMVQETLDYFFTSDECYPNWSSNDYFHIHRNIYLCFGSWKMPATIIIMLPPDLRILHLSIAIHTW